MYSTVFESWAEALSDANKTFYQDQDQDQDSGSQDQDQDLHIFSRPRP